MIGDRTFIGKGVIIAVQKSVTIGRDCLLAEYVVIHDSNHAIDNAERLILEQGFVAEEVVIGENTWIGAGATIVKGGGTGSGCVIGAGSIVTRKMPSMTVAAGIPARVLKDRASSKTAEKGAFE